jgi:hypothetical protein
VSLLALWRYRRSNHARAVEAQRFHARGEIMKLFRSSVALFLCSLLAACAGTDFVKPADDKLVVGTTTKAQVMAMFGEPYTKGQKTINGETVDLLNYAYASFGQAPAFETVTPARGMNFGFYKDVLVGKEFMSSFKADSTHFAADKARAVKQGMRKADVIALMGPPGGEQIYPFIQNPKGQGLVYVYSQAKGFSFAHRLLVVELDEKGIVERTNFTEAGEF